jgi:hypothetical protein
MKKNLLILGTAIFLAACSGNPSALVPNAAAQSEGAGSSGGGKGVLCHGSLRTLDLYEAEEIYHLPIPQLFNDLDSNLTEYGTRLKYYLTNEPFDVTDLTIRAGVLADMKTEIISLIQDIPTGTTLPSTNDATLPVLEAGCSVVQIAVYDDAANIIKRNLTLWNQLSIADQTALLLHESLYKDAREMNAKTSDDTRRIIGLTLSDQVLDAELKPILGKPHLGCFSFDSAGNHFGAGFYVVADFQQGTPGVSLYFQFLNNTFVLGRTSIFLPNVTLDSFRSGPFPVVDVHTPEAIFDRDWEIKISSASTNNVPSPTALPEFQIQAQAVGSPIMVPSAGICADQ